MDQLKESLEAQQNIQRAHLRKIEKVTNQASSFFEKEVSKSQVYQTLLKQASELVEELQERDRSKIKIWDAQNKLKIS